MANWYDILDVAREAGYSARLPLTPDAQVTFERGEGEQTVSIAYPMHGISLRADEVIRELKQRREQK